MADLNGVVDARVRQAMLAMHTLFLARVVRTEGRRATVQPLTLAKDAHGAPYTQPLVAGAPCMRGVHLQPGEVVLCAVCERDISRALRGELSLPAARHHDLSDTVIVGVMDDGL